MAFSTLKLVYCGKIPVPQYAFLYRGVVSWSPKFVIFFAVGFHNSGDDKYPCKNQYHWSYPKTVLLKYGRQIRPMNPSGEPWSYHRWSIWRPMDSLGFAKKCFLMTLTVDRPFHRCTDIKCPLCLSKMRTPFFDHFLLVAWSQQFIDWRTTQNWDGPPNHQS